MIKETIDRVVKAEVLVIGCEAAGGRAAIEAAEQGADVLIVTKGVQGRSGNTIMAGTSVQISMGAKGMDSRDNPDIHMHDVIKGGAYLNNQKLVERLVNLAPEEPPLLEKWGAKFIKSEGKYYQIALPGESYPRAVKLQGDRGGVHFRRAFQPQIKRLGIRIMEDVYITRLLLSSDGRTAGASEFR